MRPSARRLRRHSSPPCGRGFLADFADPAEAVFIGILILCSLSALLYFLLRVLRRSRFPADFTARVVHVCDGDTVWVRTWYARRFKVRLLGIDAPESGQNFGREAENLLSRLVLGEMVQLHAVGYDVYGRLLAAVSHQGEDVCLKLLTEGAAWAYHRGFVEIPSETGRRYRAAEKAAKTERRGLWARPSPQAPWEWRAERRTPWQRFLLWLRALILRPFRMHR